MSKKSGSSKSTIQPPGKDDDLPAGWVRVASRSKPGMFYYAHPATKRTQVEKPTWHKPQAPKEPAAEAVEIVHIHETSAQTTERLRREADDERRKKQRKEDEEKKKMEAVAESRKRAAEEAALEEAALEEQRKRAAEKRVAMNKALEERKREEEEEEKEKRRLAAEKREAKKAAAEAAKQAQEDEEKEERMRAAERRAKTKAAMEAAQQDSDNEEENAGKEDDDSDDDEVKGNVVRRVSARAEWAKKKERKKKWQQDMKDDSSDDPEEITGEDFQKWKEDEEMREKEEDELRRMRKEEEYCKIVWEEYRKIEAARELERAEKAWAEQREAEAKRKEEEAIQKKKEEIERMRKIMEEKAEAERQKAQLEKEAREEKQRQEAQALADAKAAVQARQAEFQKQAEMQSQQQVQQHAAQQAYEGKPLQPSQQQGQWQQSANQQQSQWPAGNQQGQWPSGNQHGQWQQSANQQQSQWQQSGQQSANQQQSQWQQSGQQNHWEQWGGNGYARPPPPRPVAPRGPHVSPLGAGGVSFGLTPRQAEAPEAKVRQMGTIMWYNGRRRTGMLKADSDSKMYSIPAIGAPNGGMAPPVPGGLMHGTRVSFFLQEGNPGEAPLGMDVRPVDGQLGLSCGGDSNFGNRVENEDRTFAADLQEGLGHMVAIFDGHRGTSCADFLVQTLPKTILSKTTEVLKQHLVHGTPQTAVSSKEEEALIRNGIIAGFEAADLEYLQAARGNGWGDGCSAVVAVLMHGFEIPTHVLATTDAVGTLRNAPTGQAKLFACWCGTGRMLVLRGRQGVRVTEDHVCSREDERRRVEACGGLVVQDIRGMWWMGRPDRPDLVRPRQQGYESNIGPKSFLAASRGFGDLNMKDMERPILTASPDVHAVDLTPEDWAIVLGGRGVFTVLGDQEVADICWQVMTMSGGGPVEAAQAVTKRAFQKGAKDNLTVIVMRLGWAQPNPQPQASPQQSHMAGGQPQMNQYHV